jgi:SSS family solute:Na+ symporter
MVLFALSQVGVLNLHFTLVAGLTFAISLLILTLTGLAGRPFEPAPQSVWTPAMARPETLQRWWADYRLQALALLLLTVALVMAFR